MQTPGPTPARPPVVVVTLPAEIDMANQPGVADDLLAAVASGAAVVIADMTATTFTDTTGIRALVLAHKQAMASGTEFRVATASRSILRVMSILGLGSYLTVYPSVQEAQAGRPATGEPAAR